MSPANPSTATGIILIATADNGSMPLSFKWTFGDNQTGSGQTVSHFYAAPGSYLITLTVRDAIGQTRQVAKHVSVSPPPPPQLLVNMSFTTRTPLTGEHVVFKSNITGGTPPYTVLWSFGDRHTGNKTRLSHTYYTAGDYNVTLMVRDSGGQTTVSSTLIIVGQFIPPVTVPQKTQAQETTGPGPFLSDEVLVGLAVLIFTVSVGFLVLWKRAFRK